MNKYSSSQINKVKELLKNGVSYKDIEKKTKVSKHSINYYSSRFKKTRQANTKAKPRSVHKRSPRDARTNTTRIALQKASRTLRDLSFQLKTLM